MRAVEFVSSNPDSTVKYWGRNLRIYTCPYCSLYGECQQGDEMPVISPLSRYVMAWHAQSRSFPTYPLSGTWEDQPAWYNNLIAAVGNKYNQLEKERMESKQ